MSTRFFTAAAGTARPRWFAHAAARLRRSFATADPAPLVLYRATRPIQPLLIVGAGVSMAIFWGNVGATMHTLLSTTTAIPNPNAEPGTLAHRIPIFVRKTAGVPEPGVPEVSAEEQPSELRPWLVAALCGVLGVGSISFTYRYAARMVHEIVYDARKRSVTVVAGLRGGWKTTVPVDAVRIRRPIASQRSRGSPVVFVKVPEMDEPRAFVLDVKGEYKNEGSMMDALFYKPAETAAAGKKK
ncbi:hypothetical protein AMAG_15344 [Allomyces macrogynus ATCC 38327]|uniref:Transmembrane protein n=1 Tax=Allomyces macrogynus (strain ATCC 38327) TaxID=578462 RepID=A0A0L0T978_ALLM3|nr:hypothetical protein AMAG_15344 [Allomyces macrogynus ATCC 38327]|eukprot:KNE71094.1 hypothetical protein AMAG_15344 [Allomyces macrogynus ATCC 38327]